MPDAIEQTPRRDVDHRASVRFGLSELKKTKRTLVGTLTLSESDEEKWTAQCSGDTEEVLDKIRTALDMFREERQRAGEIDAEGRSLVPPDWRRLSDTLARQGFAVEELPKGDHQVEIQLDLDNGMLVGRHDALHRFASPDNPLGRQVFEAIAGGFRKACDNLADTVDARLAEHDISGAIEVIKREADKGVFSLPPTNNLLTALFRVDVSSAEVESDRRLLRDCRLRTAQRLDRFDLAGSEANAILKERDATLTREERAALEMVIAISAINRGNRETGLSILRRLLNEPDQLPAEERGWAWRNISLTVSIDDPEAQRASRLSADAFLESGNKQEAGKSLMRLANILMREDAGAAVATLDEMMTLLDREGLVDRYVRSAALHARANRLAMLGKHSEAFRDASEAVALRRGLLGAETGFVSSLYLAAVAAGRLGDVAAAQAFEREARTITDEQQIPHFQLAERVSALATSFDSKAAEDLVRDAEAANNLDVLAAVRVCQVTMDSALTDTARLELLEETLRRLTTAEGGRSMVQPLKHALARQLVRMGELQRAEAWYREMLSANPRDISARNELLDCLWRLEKWGDAAILLKKQIGLTGEMPGLLFAYGKSLLEAGDARGATSALTKSLQLGGNDNLRKSATELRERALQQVDDHAPSTATRPDTGPVTRDEFETALAAFARFVAADRRMGFWRAGNGNHKWIPRPEGRAQDLLHSYLKARFDERVDIFQELATGAGRVDLFVRLNGGLSIVVELKMCGFGYSSSYAAEGEEQVKHYMDNRRTHLGYLVVFDARIDKFGAPFDLARTSGHTIITRTVDVRPRVKRG
ncbi:MAG: hypothetical protein ABR878_08275 [Roseiarcus sp.]|jgi:tetratricopeptide (TPR) repeat protein